MTRSNREGHEPPSADAKRWRRANLGFLGNLLCHYAGDLRQKGIAVVPRPETPTGNDPAHAELPDLNAGNYKSDETLERQRLLAEELYLKVKGPFASF